MQLYSFSGVVNPFKVRIEFYEGIEKFKEKIGKDPSDIQKDVLACALYDKYFGFANDNMESVDFFKVVNEATKPNISEVANIVVGAGAIDKILTANKKFNVPTADKFVEAIKPENLNQLKELAIALYDNETVRKSYLLADRLNDYVKVWGSMPRSFRRFVQDNFSKETQEEDLM